MKGRRGIAGQFKYAGHPKFKKISKLHQKVKQQDHLLNYHKQFTKSKGQYRVLTSNKFKL